MSITASIEEVTTEDATPTVAPFRISEVSGKDFATIAWKAVADSTIRAWRVRFEPLNRNVGLLIEKRGMVCGSGDRCGEPTARSLAAASPLEIETVVADSDLPPEPDGDYDIKVWAMRSGEWST